MMIVCRYPSCPSRSLLEPDEGLSTTTWSWSWRISDQKEPDHIPRNRKDAHHGGGKSAVPPRYRTAVILVYPLH
jgi:hypothetical protein